MRITPKVLARLKGWDRWRSWRLLKRHYDCGTKGPKGEPAVRRKNDGRRTLYTTTKMLPVLLADDVDVEEIDPRIDRRLRDIEEGHEEVLHEVGSHERRLRAIERRLGIG